MSRLQGYDATRNFFKDLEKRAATGGRAVAEAAAETIYEESQKLVPVSDPQGPRSRDYSLGTGREVPSGYLKAGGGWEVYETSSGLVKARVYYAASYAVYVHEVFAGHAVGQWKYLEQAVKNVSPRLQEIAANVWKSTTYGAYTYGRAFVPPGSKGRAGGGE
jgi:hypothetical protein